MRVPLRQTHFLRRQLRRAIKHLSETSFSQSTHKVCKARTPPARSQPCVPPVTEPAAAVRSGRALFFNFLFFFFYAQCGKNLIPFSFQINSSDFCKLFNANMKHQFLVVLLCASCGASALGTTNPAVSTLNFTGLGAAQGYETDTTAKIRKRRYISQNDMLAILDYHNKVRGRVFPPASNMEYMVSESFKHLFQNLQQLLVYPRVCMKCLCVRKGTTGAQITLQQTTKAVSSERKRLMCICCCRRD